jgi:ribosomal protein S26
MRIGRIRAAERNCSSTTRAIPPVRRLRVALRYLSSETALTCPLADAAGALTTRLTVRREEILAPFCVSCATLRLTELTDLLRLRDPTRRGAHRPLTACLRYG